MKTLPFIGRDKAIAKLNALLNKKIATLAVVKGRRRIGKSRLIEEFGKNHRFLHFSGIPPDEGVTIQDQRDVFAYRLGQYCQQPALRSNDWMDLLQMLADQTRTGRVIILLDEISWMALDDPTFLGKLKTIWDLEFKKNPQLILILCGSVSIWIEKNILSSTGYFGRIPVKINLDELSLKNSNKLLDTQQFIGTAYEKFQILSITGGIPYYLEQLQPGVTAEKNIKQLCFEQHAVLVDEFNDIFHDLFDSKGEIYKKIITLLANGNMENSDIARALNYHRSGPLSDYLQELTTSNFVTRDYCWSFKSGKNARLSKYRLSDNYLRFYLKFIEPNLERINKGYYDNAPLSSMPGLYTVLGLQFENLVLKNRLKVFDILGINPADIVSDNPYFQHQTVKHQGCQIDYLIQTRLNTLFLCEIKFSKNMIDSKIIEEVQEKVKRLSKPRNFSCFPILIHVNGVSDAVADSGYFYKIIEFGEMLV